MNENIIGNANVTTQSSGLAHRLAPAMLSILLGTIIVGAVGFAPGIAHNAAHDTRHVMTFPCH